MHTFAHRRRSQPRKATISTSGAVRARRLAQGHLDTQSGGAGDRKRNHPVTGQTALPPEPHASSVNMSITNYVVTQTQTNPQQPGLTAPRKQSATTPYLEGAHESLVHAHHGAGVVELPAVVGGREQCDELPLGEELVAVFYHLGGGAGFSTTLASQRETRHVG